MVDKERKQKSDSDFAVTAFRVVQEATGKAEPEPIKKKNFDAKALGRKGGLKGGRARADKLTPEQRKDIARVAAVARWNKSKL
jgi:hypothetical protein